MNELRVKKIHPDAVLPKRAKEGDVAYDLVAIDDGKIKIDERDKLLFIEYDTGIIIQVPKGYHTELDGRSSVTDYDLILKNCIGWIDEGYRNSLILRFWITTYEAVYMGMTKASLSVQEEFTRSNCKLFKKGDRIAQLKIHETIIFPVVEVDELSETNRGEGNFGSSGK